MAERVVNVVFNHMTRRRIRRLRLMHQRVTEILTKKRSEGGHSRIVLQTLEAEKAALEWVLTVLDVPGTSNDQGEK